ncbi:unnamed protein product [Thlaspi arvense]|uniref:Uncharacterized protein n=1 Tax=Thlaspi arvense TaxID=13288 RepID=A0AAU9SZJ6_THLAR|nr:unnamed protein product [Thlaspi arvense]
MSDNKDHSSDSDDAPEEITQEQAMLEDAALRKVLRENKARVSREKKESRRFLAEKLTPKKSRKIETFEEEEEAEEDREALAKKGFLSKNIIDFLAEREKQKNGSDSEVEEANEIPRKKKQKSSGSSAILKNSGQALRLVTGAAFAKKQRQRK